MYVTSKSGQQIVACEPLVSEEVLLEHSPTICSQVVCRGRVEYRPRDCTAPKPKVITVWPFTEKIC